VSRINLPATIRQEFDERDGGIGRAIRAEHRRAVRRKKPEAAIADSMRDPEHIKSSPGDEPVLAFMPRRGMAKAPR
jgi:hypothetical protein